MTNKQAPTNQYFMIEGGPTIPSLIALRAYLPTMPVKQYEIHVNETKNDFATWIENAIGEHELSKKVRTCKSKEEMIWALDDYFAEQRMRGQPIAKNTAQQELGMADAEQLQEDEQFNKQKEDVNNSNERLSKKYEDIAKNMQAALNDTMPKELEQMSDKLLTKHSELLTKITEARRSGKDMLIPSLVLKQFIPKLNLAKATRDKKDFALAQIILSQTEAEITDALETKDIDVKKEVLELAGIKTTETVKAGKGL